MQEIFWPAINEQSDDSRIGWNFDDCWSPFSRPIHFTRGLFLECYSLLTLYASDILLLSLLFPASLGKKDKTRKEKKEKNAREAECRFARRWSPFQFIPCGRRRTIARALSYFIFRIAFGVCALTGKRQVCSPKGSAERTCPTAVCAGQIQTFFFFQIKKGRPVKETDYWTQQWSIWVDFTLFVHFLHTRLSMYGWKRKQLFNKSPDFGHECCWIGSKRPYA